MVHPEAFRSTIGRQPMHFEPSGVDVFPLIPPLVAFVISLFTSMGGVSGAFLLLPFQMSVLGFTAPAVSSTNQLYNVVAIPGGVWRYLREGRMLWPLTWVVVGGTLPGVLVGAIIRLRWLPDAVRFKLFAAAVLLSIGGRVVWDLARGSGKGATEAEARFAAAVQKGNSFGGVTGWRLSWARAAFTFADEEFSFSVPGVFAMSLVVGVAAGIYGIGGGSILAPFFVAVFGLPVYTIAGATLMGTFVTSVAGVSFYQALAPLYPGVAVAPDWGLGLLFGVGGLAGTYCGARLQKHVRARAIKWMLGGVILFTAVKYVVSSLPALMR